MQLFWESIPTIHSRFTLRRGISSAPDGGISPQLVIGILQSATRPVDPKDPAGPEMAFEGGCVIIADLYQGKLRYCIRKDLSSSDRLERQQAFANREFASLRSTYLGKRPLQAHADGSDNEPFALIHRSHY